MSRLLIVGAGGFGREMFDAVNESPRYREAHDITEVAYLDDDATLVGLPAPIVGPVRGFAPQPDDIGLCALGDSAIRRDVVADLESAGLMFPAFVHHTARVGSRTRLADGVVICAGAVLTCDITIGRHSHVNIGCSLGHDVALGEFVTLSGNCHLAGGVDVSDGVFFGTSANVIPRIRIGEAARVGAGSVVIRRVSAGTTVFGNPAKKV